MHWGVDLVWYALAFLAGGVAAGFVAGFFGIGGGVFTVPLFLFLFSRFGVAPGVVMHEAVGTSLALIGPAAIMATRQQVQMGRLDVDYFKGWWPWVLAGVVGGLFALAFVAGFWLKVIFVCFLALVAIYEELGGEKAVVASEPPTGWARAVVAGLIGGCSVLVGSGGGVFTTPAMKACSYPIARSIALSSATAVVVGFGGAVGVIIAGLGVAGRPHFSFGYVDLLVFIITLPTVMIFAPIGAKVMIGMKPDRVRHLFALFLILLAIYMVLELTGVVR